MKKIIIENPFVKWYPPDTRELNPNLGGETAAAKSLKPGGAPGETKNVKSDEDEKPSSKKKPIKKKVIRESLKDEIKARIRRRQIMLYRIDEVSPPGQEDWIKKNKNRFKERYGKDYKKFLYGHAWNNYNAEEIILKEGVTVQDIQDHTEDFIKHASAHLNLKSVPPIRFKQTEAGSTFATWSPDEITISITNRHPMDVFRSLAHELVHHKQHEDDVLHAESGQTGSEHENEANAVAGVIMRDFAKANPDLFSLQSIEEAAGTWKGTAYTPKPRRSVGSSLGFSFGKLVRRAFTSGKTTHPKTPKPAASPKPKKPDPSFEDKVDAEYTKQKEKEAIKSEVKKRLQADEKNGKTVDVHKIAYQSAMVQAMRASNVNTRKNLLDIAKVHAAKLSDQGHAVNPASDFNALRHLKRRNWHKPDKKLKPPPADARLKRGEKPGSPKPLRYDKDKETGKSFAVYESKELSLRETIAITRRSQMTEIPYEILLEVYQRGLKDWKPDGVHTMEQWAWNRVNSFIAGGKAAELDDDLFTYEED